MTTYNLREASKHGVPEPRDGYEQRKVLYTKYNAAVVKGWSKRVDDGVEYTDKDFVLCERRLIPEAFLELHRQALHDTEMQQQIIDSMIVAKTPRGYFLAPEFEPEDIHGILISGSNGSVIMEKDDNGTFMVTNSDVPEAVGVGDTPEEAIADLEVAVEIVAEIKKKRVNKSTL